METQGHRPEQELSNMQVKIKESDLVNSLADALQFISHFHAPDYITNLATAYAQEESFTSKNAIGQILVNARMAAIGKRPICQDTGTAQIFMEIGLNVRIMSKHSLQELADRAVRQAWLEEANPLRASVVEDPLFSRKNTGDNTPAILHVDLVAGNKLKIHVAAKGGGSENKARFAALEPSDNVEDWIVKTVETLGAGWCPPGLIGVGVGGSPERAMLLAKRSLLDPIDMPDLLHRGPRSHEEELRIKLYQRINALGIGAQGLGGITTVLDVKIKSFPTHAASLPIGLIPQCAADRHVSFELDGSGPAHLPSPDLLLWPEIILEQTKPSRRINLDTLTRDDVREWKAGETMLVSGHLVTGRDAAHKRLSALLAEGKALPVDLRNRTIYYVGPVTAVGDEAVGPAGPTTSTRMDRFTDELLEKTGLLVMIGKAERGPDAIASIARHGAAYLIAVGGAAYLVSKAIRSSRVIAFDDLGMEAIHEFIVEDMPVTVAVDATGASIHHLGPKAWRR
jgi:fumarate hydratase, class I